MINRLKAHFHVYAGHWELACIILALVVGGVTTGYVLRGAQTTKALAQIQAAHTQEIERIQLANREVLGLLANRLGALADGQAAVVEKADQATKEASAAASTARRSKQAAETAAASAARARIRITETPISPAIQPDKHAFPEVIEP